MDFDQRCNNIGKFSGVIANPSGARLPGKAASTQCPQGPCGTPRPHGRTAQAHRNRWRRTSHRAPPSSTTAPRSGLVFASVGSFGQNPPEATAVVNLYSHGGFVWPKREKLPRHGPQPPTRQSADCRDIPPGETDPRCDPPKRRSHINPCRRCGETLIMSWTSTRLSRCRSSGQRAAGIVAGSSGKVSPPRLKEGGWLPRRSRYCLSSPGSSATGPKSFGCLRCQLRLRSRRRCDLQRLAQGTAEDVDRDRQLRLGRQEIPRPRAASGTASHVPRRGRGVASQSPPAPAMVG
jgi:hypothetical protein